MLENKYQSHPIHLGIIFLILGLAGFFLWAFFAPLDEGVPCQGSVAIDTKRKIIQHSSGGIVKKIYVKEGQLVKAGDILLSLDDAPIKGRLEETRQHYFGLRAAEDRLIAEKRGSDKIKFHPDLLAFEDNPLVIKHMQNQRQLLLARRTSLNAAVKGHEESMKGFEAQIVGYKNTLNTLNDQLTILKSQLNKILPLVSDGFVPLVQQQDIEMKISSIEGRIEELKSNIFKSEKIIGELHQKVITIKEDFKKETENQEAQVILDVDAFAQKLKALNEEFERIDLKSPVEGQVIGLQFQTIGAVIQPSQRILDVVPQNEGLLLEGKIPPSLIDRVKLGQKAKVRFTNFLDAPQLMVEGVVESVSQDLLTDPPSAATNQAINSYYLARIFVTKEGAKTLGQRTLQPGMQVQILIKSGERSFYKYLMGPFLKRLSSSFA